MGEGNEPRKEPGDGEDAVDSRGLPYNSDSGATMPTEGKCNALLTYWRDRYGEPRYCSRNQLTDHDYCRLHKSREALDMRAEELLKHGFFTKTLDHLYEKLDPWEKVFSHGLFETLMGESKYEFAEEYEQRQFDFSEADVVPSVAGDDDVLRVEVAYPTAHGGRALALFNAAMDKIKMTKINAIIAEDNMQTTSTEHAQLTSPTDADPSQTFQTIEEVSEHHLNLPYSRLVRDRKELLKEGGVEVDGETDTAGGEFDFEKFEDVGADPELHDSEVERIKEHAEDE